MEDWGNNRSIEISQAQLYVCFLWTGRTRKFWFVVCCNSKGKRCAHGFYIRYLMQQTCSKVSKGGTSMPFFTWDWSYPVDTQLSLGYLKPVVTLWMNRGLCVGPRCCVLIFLFRLSCPCSIQGFHFLFPMALGNGTQRRAWPERSKGLPWKEKK